MEAHILYFAVSPIMLPRLPNCPRLVCSLSFIFPYPQRNYAIIYGFNVNSKIPHPKRRNYSKKPKKLLLFAKAVPGYLSV